MNQLSNLSYTNKDFNSIYAELLQYAKDVSYRWDPTVSDESDPGVVLLKLAAIIGDKDNYNIDQNILELFPASVSQPAAARQLFEQCGYSMRHYQAAEGSVNIMFNGYKGEDTPVDKDLNGVTYTASNNIISVDRFTMLTDANNRVVYTTTRKIESISLKATQSVPVIEGTVTSYTINNEEVITAQHVDLHRRLYFTEMDVAENGIFITNSEDIDDIDDWHKEDNLSTQALGTKCYKFGVTSDGTTCFVEFPEDYVDLFGNGIAIKYIRTTGRKGNIAARVLKNFFAKPDESLDIVVSNPLPILNGDDPETIDDAYRSYKRVKDTFDTLVSLKDYTDYMTSHSKASNGYVCDRTNDIQRVSKVQETLGSSKFIASIVDSEASMTPFDLCVYALEYVSSCSSTSTSESEAYYRKSFQLINPASSTGRRIFGSTDSYDIKSLQHDFLGFEQRKILMIKNKYPIKTTIIPRYKLNVAQQMEVSDNVRFALYEALKSRELTFGSAPDYDYIYNTVLTADERIKAVAVEYPTYETYAVYWPESGAELAEVRIDSAYNEQDDPNKDLINEFRETILTRNILNGATPVYKKADKFTYGAGQSNIEKFENVTRVTTATNIELKAGEYTTIGSNEAILLSAPSLIEENKFSNYVKVLYNFSREVNAGTYYTLTGNDYLIFFWKAKPEDTEYTCIKYDGTDNSKSKTFFTNVKLKQTNSASITISNVNHVATKLQAGSLLNSTIAELSAEITSAQDNACVLTGTSCITTYTVNSVLVNNNDTGSSYVYWILNKTVTGSDGKPCYKLFDLESGSTEYTLESGEYFLYTNSEKTLLHVVGEGTLIVRDGDLVPTSSNWECPPLDYASITDITVLDDYWATIPVCESSATTGRLYVTEQQLIALGPKSKVKPSAPVTLSNTAIDVAAGFVYQEGEGASDMPLPTYGDPALVWKARSRLDLNTGPNKPQKLTESQQIHIGSETITGSATTYIQADRDIQVSGGSNIDLTQLAGLKLLKPATLQSYNFQASSTTSLVYYNPETLTTSITSTASTTISVPPGDYLLSFRKGTATTVRENPISGDESPEYVNDIRTHFIYHISNSTVSNKSLIVSGGAPNDPLIIDPYVRLIDSGITATIWNNLQQIGGKVNFDPIACAKDASLIDPLDSNSFLKTEHAYNKFTICEWQESDVEDGTDIRVLASVR